MLTLKRVIPTSFLFVLFITFTLTGCDENLLTSSVKKDDPAPPGAVSHSTNASQAKSASVEFIPGQYIVVFKDKVGKSKVAEHAQTLIQVTDGKIASTWTTALKGFAVEGITEEAAQAISNNPNVKYVEQEFYLQGGVRETVGSNPGDAWGLDRIDQRSGFDGVYTAGATGSGVTVYIIDTGVRVSHNAFGGRASHGYDFVDNDGTANDCNGHGTHVAGTAAGNWYGVAQGADIVAVRVLACDGLGEPSDIVDGVQWVMNNHSSGPAVINMSIESGRVFSSVNNAVQNAIDAGFPVVTIAGNHDQDASTSSPGSVEDAITVASTDVNDTRANSSNHGSLVDLFAPGEEILSAWNGSDSDTEVISGTSMAAPHVAGTAAMYLEDNPSATPQQIRDFILQYATKNVVSDAQSANDHLLYSLLNHPKVPENLSVSCVADDSPYIDWDPSPSSDTDHYEVLRSTASTFGYSVIATTSLTSYDDTEKVCADGTNGDAEYYYRTRTVDTESLLSGESNFDSAITTSEPPYLQSQPVSDSLQVNRLEKTVNPQDRPLQTLRKGNR